MACAKISLKMKICIIGHKGFIGNTIYNYFIDKHSVFTIEKKTKNIPKEEFDIVINCAGNAKKYLSEKKPFEDVLTNAKIFHTILQLKIKKFIHISSISASEIPNNNYTISKLISENYSKLYFPNCIILRIGGVIGPNLKKNVVFDIINNKNLFITFDSTYNYISTHEIAKIIEKIIKLNIKNEIINVAASQPICVNNIIKEAKKEHIIFNKSEGNVKENYKYIEINKLNSFFKVKTSRYYIRNFFKSINK
jgi:nucleoside-diphosphate-sugar epimerase